MSESTDLSEGATANASDTPAANGSGGRRRGSGLSGKLLPELQQIAGDLGISGTAKMRKSELIAAIQSAQSGGQSASKPSTTAESNTEDLSKERNAGSEKGDVGIEASI